MRAAGLAVRPLIVTALLLGAPAGSSAAAAMQASAAGADVVVTWNRLGYAVAYGEDAFRTFKGQRALAMMNVAMHDAVNTIVPVYERHAYRGGSVKADAEAAAAWAAYGVLRAEYPASESRLDSLIAHQRAGDAGEAAAALGRAVADAILMARRGDGWDAPGTYSYVQEPGRYRTTPDWNGFVLQPGFRDARPFTIGSVRAFRPEPPPGLTEAAYADAYAEVKARGGRTSETRTADQAAYAVWWMEFPEGSVNRLARRLAGERDLDLWAASRLFAHLHMALYDAYIATWDSKYEYDHWRPYTAIRLAAGDGNPDTAPDPEWTSLLPAPPFPEYVSAHAAGCAAAFRVLSSVFGDSTRFTMTTITAPDGMPERSFARFTAAAAECADSRVQLGWHFRYSTDAGLALGGRVADHVLRTSLRARDADRISPAGARARVMR